VRFDDLHARADEADILITSTGSPEFLFRPPHAQRFLHRRRNRPMFFIDIAVPRDVDPEINRLEGIFLYDIDDLQAVAASNLADRSSEARRAESILEQELVRYQRRMETLDVVPALVDLQAAAEEMRQAELRRNLGRLRSLTGAQMAAVEAITRGLMNKFLHQPLQVLKAAAREGDAATVEAIRAAFHRAAGPADEEGSLSAEAKPEDSISAVESESLTPKR
jgi:glutamyl-tRNA reductase